MRITINISKQTLRLIEGKKVLKIYPVSTSKNGSGQEWESYKTPLGKHCIAEKIGEEAEIGSVFKERIKTGEVVDIDSSEIKGDPVVTRVITLKGLDEGLNSGDGIDSYRRRIYIHGTVHESLIGQPVSNGCIRMRSKDIIELFGLVEEGTVVNILTSTK